MKNEGAKPEEEEEGESHENENEIENEDEEGENSVTGSGLGGDRKKQKRRSKNDIQGRDHKCSICDKTYLSYPALYTHMKNKHAKGPDG